jgi:hypothetical protein
VRERLEEERKGIRSTGEGLDLSQAAILACPTTIFKSIGVSSMPIFLKPAYEKKPCDEPPV